MHIEKKNIFITGADGFIGSHLVETLVKKGCQVKALSYYNSFNTWGWLDTLPQEIISAVEVIVGDVRDPEAISHAIQGCDVVFHLAALIGIPYSYQAPRSYVETNISGTLNVLQASLKHDVEKIIITSTSEVYGTAQYVPIDEVHPLQGQSPYSASKIAADKIGESFYCSFGAPVVTVRPFNTYGPRQSARAIIPTVISQLIMGQKEISLGDVSPKRDFTYVQDTVDGFIRIAECQEAVGRTINIANQTEHSIQEVAQILIDAINPSASIVLDKQRIRPEKSEVHRLFGSNRLIKELTGWAPNFGIEKGLKETVRWFLEADNMKLYNKSIYTV